MERMNNRLTGNLPMELVSARDVTLSYDGRPVVENLSFSVNRLYNICSI